MNEVKTESFDLLKALVEALDKAYISSWQSTAAWQKELDDAREFISLKEELQKYE